MSHILSWTTNNFSAKYACKNSCFKSEKKKIILLSCTHLRKLVCILVKTLRMKKSLGQVSTTFKLCKNHVKIFIYSRLKSSPKSAIF